MKILGGKDYRDSVSWNGEYDVFEWPHRHMYDF